MIAPSEILRALPRLLANIITVSLETMTVVDTPPKLEVFHINRRRSV
jgi:hypothetical protein